MYLQGITIFCLAIVPISFCNDNIYNDRVFDQIQQAILTGADTDHKYEIVPIQLSERLHKRMAFLPAGQFMRTRAFGENIDLWLHPKNSIFAGDDTPVYHAKYAPGRPQNVTFELQKNLMRGVGHILENPAELASVVIGTGKYEGKRVNGRLGKRGIVIRSLPQTVVDEYVRKRRSIDGQADSSNLNYHLVYKDDNSRDVVEEVVLREKVMKKSSSTIPYILYPKVLVVVEFSMYRAREHDVDGFLEYLLAFWNGVDLKYRSLNTPKIRFNIAGIILAADPWALSYITKNNPDDGQSLDLFHTIRSATTFFAGIQKSFPLDSYDVAVTMTTLVLGKDVTDSHVMGQAWPKTACMSKPGSGTTYAIAIVNDNGAFQGVHTAAHEVGHTFGLGHDASTDDCNFSNGFIMSPTPWYTKNSTLFSSCSLEQFNKRLQEGGLECMYNPPPRRGKQLPKLSPGKMLNLDEQCVTREAGVAACTPEDNQDVDVCVNYWCRQEDGQCVKSGIAALEGSPCSIENQVEPGFCVRNQCVHL